MPVDCDRLRVTELISLRSVFVAMQNGPNRGPNVVILDACHENELADMGRFVCRMTNRRLRDPVKLIAESDGWVFERRALEHYLTKSARSPQTGLPLSNTVIVDDTSVQKQMAEHNTRCSILHVKPPPNTVILMSTAPGTLEPVIDTTLGSLDRLHTGRSCFATAFISMVSQDINICTLAAKIRHLVSVETAGEQVPYENDTLEKHHMDFCMNGHKAKQLDGVQLQDLDEADENSGGTLKDFADDLRVVASSSTSTFLMWLRFGLPSAKTAVASGQVLKGMPYAFGMSWPDSLNSVSTYFVNSPSCLLTLRVLAAQVLEVMSVIQLEIFSFVNFSCLGEWTFYHKLAAYTFLPLILSMVLYGVSVLHRRRLIQQGHFASLKDLRVRSLEFGFLICMFVYPVISQTIFQTFLCQQLDEDTSRLVVDFQVDCNSEVYTFAVVYAGIMVLLWPIGVPLILFVGMWLQRDELRKPGSLAREELSPLVDGYQYGCWYWESVEMARKVVLTSMICFFARGSLQQLVAGAVVSTIFLVAAAGIRPFRTKFDNDFKIASDIALVVTFNISVLLRRSSGLSLQSPFTSEPGSGDSQEQGPIPVWVLELILIAVNLLLPMGMIIPQILRLKSRRPLIRENSTTKLQNQQAHGHHPPTDISNKMHNPMHEHS